MTCRGSNNVTLAKEKKEGKCLSHVETDANSSISHNLLNRFSTDSVNVWSSSEH